MNSERVYLYERVRMPLEQFVLSFISETVKIRIKSFSLPNNGIVYKGEAGQVLRWEIPEEFRHRNVLNIDAVRVSSDSSFVDFDEAILIQVE